MLTSYPILFRQIIKPSLPTPTRLKRYNLSFMDQVLPSVYIPFIFHYPNHSAIGDSIEEKSRCLRNSLSDTLTQYYPFAGRLNSTRSYVDCNDEGIEFQEVGIECQQSEVIKKPVHELRDLLYPKHEFMWKEDSAFLFVRFNHFQCGGVSILVCLSHKLADAASFVAFMKSWAINTRRISNKLTSNHEPIMELPCFISYPDGSTESTAAPEFSWATRKFVFPNSEIAILKSKMDDSYKSASATTRVEALASFLFQRATVTANSSVDSALIALILSVNMRSKMIPPLPKTSIGNLIWFMGVAINKSNENDLKVIVEKIKAAKVEMGSMKKIEDLASRWSTHEFKHSDMYYCTSLCRMPFYQIDFGWGNPCRVTILDTMASNVFVLMDTPTGDGIEAIVSLDEHQMTAFQDDQHILAYTSS